MSDRVILHCDLNNFFASVSLLLNPTLYDVPVAVGGSIEKRHGIILAKNELAKKMGVKTAEVIWEAKRKCPDLVVIPPNYEKYHEYSKKVRAIYERYTDLVEPFGIDECWLDVTGSTMLFGSGEEIANKIRRAVKREIGLTISVGVSFNKIFAKLGSDLKKPDAVTVISKENFKEKIWNLPASFMLFVGDSTEEKLKKSGIFTIGDVAESDERTLTRLLGKNGLELKKYALGLDSSPVARADDDTPPKSVGRSVTLDHDITDISEVWEIFLSLSEEISVNLRKYNLYASGVQVHTRNTSLKVKEFSKTYTDCYNSAMVIAKRGMELFKESFDFSLPLRSVGIRAIGLKGENELSGVQQDIFGSSETLENEEKIDNKLYEVRQKFGFNSVKRGRIIDK